MLKRLITLFLLLSALAPASASAQSCDGALEWTGIVPDCLSPGDTYRIMFITSGTENASRPRITFYNTFVQGQAGLAAPFTDAGIADTFRAIGSTMAVDATLAVGDMPAMDAAPPVNAFSNTNTNNRPDGIQGEPIFYFNGRKVADNYDDFWDGTWDSLEGRDQSGMTTGSVRVWTGGESSGRRLVAGEGNCCWLGDARAAIGISGDSIGYLGLGRGSTRLLVEANSAQNRFYALSGILTVPSRVSLSEPSSATLSEGSPGVSATLTVSLMAAAPTDLMVLIDITQTTPSETPPRVTYGLDYSVAIGDDDDATGFSFDSADPGVLRTRRVVVPFAAGQSSRTLELTALSDTDTLNEDLSIALTVGDNYIINATAVARTLMLIDDDAPGVGLRLPQNRMSLEGETDRGSVVLLSVALDADAPTGLTVLIDITQTIPSSTPPEVTYGLDYGVALRVRPDGGGEPLFLVDIPGFSFDNADPGVLRTRRVAVPFAAGERVRLVRFIALEDLDGLNEVLSIRLVNANGYIVDPPDGFADSVTLTLADNEPEVRLGFVAVGGTSIQARRISERGSGSSGGAEFDVRVTLAGTSTSTVQVNLAPGNDNTVNDSDVLTRSGDDSNDVGFLTRLMSPIEIPIDIPPGERERVGKAEFRVVADNVVEPTETLQVMVVPGNGYRLPSEVTQRLEVLDDIRVAINDTTARTAVEGGTSAEPVVLEFSRAPGPEERVTATVMTLPPPDAQDYSVLVNGEVVLASGNGRYEVALLEGATQISLTVRAEEDSDTTNEIIGLRLSNVSVSSPIYSYTLTLPTDAIVLNLQDNDGPGMPGVDIESVDPDPLTESNVDGGFVNLLLHDVQFNSNASNARNYELGGTPPPGLSIAGGVRRLNDLQVAVPLTYDDDNFDFDLEARINITVLPAAHTGTQRLTTLMVPITPRDIDPTTTITSVALTSDAGDGTYRADDHIDVTVTFSGRVEVFGISSSITLTLGDVTQQAAYFDLSEDRRRLTFRYRVQPGDLAADGVSIGANALRLNGSQINDNNRRPVNLRHSAVPADPDHAVDGVAPTVSGVAITSTGPYALDEVIELTVTFDEAVTVTSFGLNVPLIDIFIGDDIRNATFTDGSGTAELVFSYTVVADDQDDNGVSVVPDALNPNNSLIQDIAGNRAVLSHAAIPDNQAHVVDTTAPRLSTETVATVDANVLTLTYDEALNATSVPASTAWTLTLASGNAPTVNSGSVTISGTTVTMRLSTLVQPGAVVTLLYSGGGANPLLDLAGNPAAAFSGQAVSNVTFIVGTIEGTVTENAAQTTATGTLIATLPDSTPAQFIVQAESVGTYGTFTLERNGDWTYTLNNGDVDTVALTMEAEGRDRFTAAISNNDAQRIVTITVNGVNDPAEIGGPLTGNLNQAEETSITGALTVTDPDNPNGFRPTDQSLGVYGIFTLGDLVAGGGLAAGTANWTYTLNPADPDTIALAADESATDMFTIETEGGTKAIITITVTGANDPPTAEIIAPAGAVFVGSVVTLSSIGAATRKPAWWVCAISGVRPAAPQSVSTATRPSEPPSPHPPRPQH